MNSDKDKSMPDGGPNAAPDNASDAASDAKADALMALALSRYGDRLDDRARAETREAIEGIVAAGDALRSAAIDNGDIPFVAPPHRG